MTPALLTARGLTAATATLTIGAVYLGTVNPWLIIPPAYVAVLLAWCARCQYAAHRRVLVRHEQARRAALGLELLDGVPCCRLADHSGGRAHRADCQRPPDPSVELNSACCAEVFVSLGATHEAQCPTLTSRSSAA
ncbi:hypothetical protein [Streptomyces sp. NPDC056105]|uniref:hypothetical protein n=1 Tax=Streptomyces sp. NPDC056105 TaxID=3345714 RepID=UPI0035D772F6